MAAPAAGILVLLLSFGVPEEKLAQGKNLLDNLEEQAAIDQFEVGLGAHPTPATKAQLALYLGLARLNLLDSAGARTAFRQAVVADPKITLPPTASPRAAALFNEERALALALIPSTSAHSDAPAAPSSWKRTVGWIVGGASLAAAAGGVVMGLSSRSARDQAVTEPSAQAARQSYDAAQARAKTANILFVGAGVLAAGSVVLLVWPTPSGPQVQLSFNF